MNILCIDPSIRNLGVAVFSNRKTDRRETETGEFKLLSSATIKNPQPKASAREKRERKRRNSWVDDTDNMVNKLRQWRINQPYAPEPDLVLIELPRVFQSEKGLAANNSGSIMKLAFCVAVLRSYFHHHTSSKVELIPVNRWKGTVPKHITQRRIKKHWGWQGGKRDHNEADAVGIGDYYIRKVLNSPVDRK